MKPTQQAYEELQVAYDHFNQALFDGALPTCLITLQREKKTYGYFSPERFVHADGKRTDEIAMNPAYFAVCPPEEIMQTLVHEMAHLWQYHFGKPGRGGYHNKEWAEKMESIGLMPSSTGQPGGARTGDKMADYAIEGGLFMDEYNNLMQEDFRISWMDRFPARDRLLAALESGDASQFAGDLSEMGIEVDENGEMSIKPGNKSNRIKYTCPQCETNLWGKPDLNVVCGDCEVTFEVAG
ncbi:SprT-like domain-containing protein [Salmonella enterica]|nr:SprT-like domain-containing protein [Salmonella enterica]ELS8927797.1 SprT-like domain-containing protein [Salmonella enterica]